MFDEKEKAGGEFLGIAHNPPTGEPSQKVVAVGEDVTSALTEGQEGYRIAAPGHGDRGDGHTFEIRRRQSDADVRVAIREGGEI